MFSPIFYERIRHRSVFIANDKVGVVLSKTGTPLPDREFLVEAQEDIYARKGVWRNVLTPGSWRMNPMAFDVDVMDATTI